jgi:DNA-binding response OmpR family regulator
MVTEHPMVLRAAIVTLPPKTPIATNTLSLSGERVWVASDSLDDLESTVLLDLSFPGLLAPVRLRAVVDEVRDASGLGAPRAVALRFVFDSERQRREIEALCSAPHDDGAAGGDVDVCYRVLLVEDSAMIREMFEYEATRYFRLQNTKLAIEVADDAERAWQVLVGRRAAGGTFDLAIVDYFLPTPGGSDGSALVGRMRANADFARIPVVAISVGGPDARRATIAAGADMFLDKPIVIRNLFSTLARLAARRGVAAATPHPKRVLVMDDSPLILEATRDALVAAGYCVDTASNLEEFEHQCGAQHDLILLDVQMPEAFGDDIAMLLRQKRGVRTKIFFLSSLDDGDLDSRVAEAEIDGFISKRRGMDAIVRRVQQILGDGVVELVAEVAR